MDYTALKAYIEGDPEFANDIAIGSDEGIAQKINARSIPVVGGIERSKFAMWCGATGLRATIQDHAETQGSPLRSVSLTLLDFLQGGVANTLDMSDVANKTMLGAWVAAGALTQAQSDELMAMATHDQPVFGQNVSHLDIAKALRG